MTDVIGTLHKKSVGENLAELRREQLQNLAAAGIDATPAALHGKNWHQAPLQDSLETLTSIVGKLTQDVAALQKQQQ